MPQKIIIIAVVVVLVLATGAYLLRQSRPLTPVEKEHLIAKAVDLIITSERRDHKQDFSKATLDPYSVRDVIGTRRDYAVTFSVPLLYLPKEGTVYRQIMVETRGWKFGNGGRSYTVEKNPPDAPHTWDVAYYSPTPEAEAAFAFIDAAFRAHGDVGQINVTGGLQRQVEGNEYVIVRDIGDTYTVQLESSGGMAHLTVEKVTGIIRPPLIATYEAR